MVVHPRRYHQAFARGELGQSAAADWLPATQPLVQRTWLSVGGTLLGSIGSTTASVIWRWHLSRLPGLRAAFALQRYRRNGVRLAASRLVNKLVVVDLDASVMPRGDLGLLTKVFPARLRASNFLAKQTSDLDLPLADGLDDQAYLQSVGDVLPALLDEQQPDLVLYRRIDPHQEDRLGKLALSDQSLCSVITWCWMPASGATSLLPA